MNKGLEAFENIIREGDFRYLSSLYDREELNEDIEIVEKELKALEILRNKLSPLARVTMQPMSQEEFNILVEVGL